MISIIIPSYRSEKIIGKVLAAIVSQKPKVNYEVILVDSTPGDQVDRVVKKYPTVVLLKQTDQTSASRGRNIGAAAAVGQLLLFIDSDVTLANDALDKIWECYENGSKIFSGSLLQDLTSGFSLAAFLEYCFFFSESFPGNPNNVRRNLPSGLLAIEEVLFQMYGPFLEYGRAEDTHLTEKIRKNGYALNYFPNIKAIFFQDLNIGDYLKKCKLNGQNIPYVRLGEDLDLKKRIFFFFTMPLLSVMKFIVMAYRNLYYRKELKYKMLFIVTSPLIAVGIFYWFLGGLITVFINPGINDKR